MKIYKLHLWFLLLNFLSITISAQEPPIVKWTLQDGTFLQYYYIDGDEFGGYFHTGGEDKNKWRNSYPWGRALCTNGENEIQYYTDGNNINYSYPGVSLVANNNSITEKAIPYLSNSTILCDGQQNLRTFNYTSGMLYFNRAIKWGLFEIRTRIPSGQGFFPAFWLYDNSEEIDIFECKGECPNKLHWDIHYPNSGNNCGFFQQQCGGWAQATGDLSTSYNVWRVNWVPDWVEWSFNADIYALHLNQFHNPLNIIVNLALGKHIGSATACGPFGSGPPFDDGPNASTPFPRSLDIDWIRVWKRLDCQQTLNICNYPSGLIDPSSLNGLNVNFNYGCTSSIGQNIDIVAMNEIFIDGETEIAGDCYARIIPCPIPGSAPRLNSTTSHYTYKEEDNGDNGIEGIIYEKPTQTIAKNIKLSIFPNPNFGIFSILSKDLGSTLEISSSSGQIIYQTKLKAEITSVDISLYGMGVYIAKLFTLDNICFEKVICY